MASMFPFFGQRPPWQTPGINPNAPLPVPLPGAGGMPAQAVPPSFGGNAPQWLQKASGGLEKVLGGMTGPAPSFLSPAEQQALQQRQRMAVAAALLQASGPRPRGTSSPLQAIGAGMQAGQQAQDQFTADALRARLMAAQIQKLQAEATPKPPEAPAIGESPLGKMFADLDVAESSGNTEAARALRAAIEKEIGTESEDDISFNDIRALRNDVKRDSEQFLEQQKGFQSVQAAAADPSAAGDLALLFGTMKVLDPGSIVREGEVQLTAGAGSLAQRVAGEFKRVFSGERLTAEQRRDFLNMARNQFEVAQRQHERVIADARAFAERNKLAVEDVVPEFVTPADKKSGATEYDYDPTTGQLIPRK